MNSFIVILLGFVTVSLAQEINKHHTLVPPFNKYGWSGNRKIEGWTCGGDATIMEYFIRLTPDRQSKSGYCWSENAINSNKWVTTVKFRISGQAEYVFGDGISIFFVNQPVHNTGNMHGSSDNFVGFAVDLTTYKSSDYIRFHRDISLYIGNNTNESAYHQDAYHPGCFSNYRYHEKRQDFSVDRFASLRISYDGDSQNLRITVDPEGSGFYQSCVIETINLPEGWWRKAYLGVSASTGGVADNHDLISIMTVRGVSVIEETETDNVDENKRDNRMKLVSMLESEGIDRNQLNPNDDVFISILSELFTLREQDYVRLKRELEHSLATIDDSINNLIRKLLQRGDVSETRIEELEESLRSRVSSSVSVQIANRIAVLERMLQSNLTQEVKKSKGAWMLPFFMLMTVLIVVFVMGFKQYRRIQKTHML